jgi:hypothetical protein
MDYPTRAWQDQAGAWHATVNFPRDDGTKDQLAQWEHINRVARSAIVAEMQAHQMAPNTLGRLQVERTSHLQQYSITFRACCNEHQRREHKSIILRLLHSIT